MDDTIMDMFKRRFDVLEDMIIKQGREIHLIKDMFKQFTMCQTNDTYPLHSGVKETTMNNLSGSERMNTVRVKRTEEWQNVEDRNKLLIDNMKLKMRESVANLLIDDHQIENVSLKENASEGIQYTQYAEILKKNMANALRQSSNGNVTISENDVLDQIETPEKRDKRREMLTKCIDELIETEKTYIADLHTIYEVFMLQMEEKCILIPEETSRIFSNVDELIVLNSNRFYRPLTELVNVSRKENIPDFEIDFTEVFLNWAAPLKEYALYSSNYPRSLMMLEFMKLENIEFKNFLVSCYKEPRCRKLDLGGWLIKPIQRLMKYPLLLKEIVRYSENLKRENLTIVFDRINESVAYVDQQQHLAQELLYDCTHVLEDIENSIISQKPLYLVRFDRTFFREGTATQIRKKKKNREIYIFLFNDLLLFCKLPVKGKFQHIETFHNSELVVEEATEIENGIIIADHTKSSVIIICFLSQEEKKSWFTTIQNKSQEIQELMMKKEVTLLIKKKSSQAVTVKNSLIRPVGDEVLSTKRRMEFDITKISLDSDVAYESLLTNSILPPKRLPPLIPAGKAINMPALNAPEDLPPPVPDITSIRNMKPTLPPRSNNRLKSEFTTTPEKPPRPGSEPPPRPKTEPPEITNALEPEPKILPGNFMAELNSKLGTNAEHSDIYLNKSAEILKNENNEFTLSDTSDTGNSLRINSNKKESRKSWAGKQKN